MTLAGKTYSAARWTALSALARAGLQLVQVAILARFLSPTDFGLMAMVMVVLSYASMFNDMGLSTAFVQRQSISHEERSSLYWLNVTVGGALMFIVMAISPLAAMFFKEPQLIPLMMLVSTNFLAVALGQQLRINAEKSLNFRPVAVIEIIAALVGFAVAALTSWLEWGVFALVLAAMTSAWLTMVMSWLILAQGWRPAWRLRWSEVNWFVHFGGGMVLNNLINHINSTVDLIVGGRILGANSFGMYSVPRNLMLQVQGIINPIFTRVGFPLISSIQNDKERVKQVYLITMNFTASVNAPIYIAIALFAPEIVLLLLGTKWTEAAPLMRVLAIWALLRSFGNPSGSLLFGLGHVSLAAKWNAGLLLVIPPVVWLGSHWASAGIAWSIVLLMLVLFVPAWLIIIKPTINVGLIEYSKQIAIPTMCALVAGFISSVLVDLFLSSLTKLVIGIILLVIIYILLTIKFNNQVFNLILKFLPK